MKTFHFILFFLTCCISFSGCTLKAQVIHDVFKGQKWEYSEVSEDIQPEFGRAAGDISLEYFQFTNPENAAQEAINKAILPLCRKPVDDESAYLELLVEFKPCLAVFKEIHETNYYDRGANEASAMADIIAIDCKPLSAVAGKLYFSIRFEFQNPIYNRRVKNPSLQYYYTADLKTGNTRRHKNSYDKATLEKVKNLISHNINAQYHVATENVSLNNVPALSPNEPGYSGLDLAGTKDMAPRIDMAEADFIPMGFGLIVQFQEYTKSSKMYSGQPFDIFLPFDRASEVANLLPGFAFPSGYKPQATNFKNFEFLKPLGQFGTALKPPNPEGWSDQSQDSVPTKLEIREYYVLKDGEKSEDQWITTIYFDTLGRPVEIVLADRSGQLGRRFLISANAEGKLLKRYIRDNKESINRMAYDKSGNSTVFEELKGSDSYVEYCFYNGPYAYLYHTEEKTLQRFKKSEDQLCVDNNCYVLNEHGQVIGVSYSEALMGYAQIAYDEQDRLVEIHRVHENEDIYIVYDEQDRLQSWSMHKDLDKILGLTCFYNNDSELPYECHEFNQNSFSSSKISIKTYSWYY